MNSCRLIQQWKISTKVANSVSTVTEIRNETVHESIFVFLKYERDGAVSYKSCEHHATPITFHHTGMCVCVCTRVRDYKGKGETTPREGRSSFWHGQRWQSELVGSSE